VFTEPLLRNVLPNPVVPAFFGADDIENSLIYCYVLDRVYRAVAWQRVDQICYIIITVSKKVKEKWRLMGNIARKRKLKES
jgi:hypothetical protein